MVMLELPWEAQYDHEGNQHACRRVQGALPATHGRGGAHPPPGHHHEARAAGGETGAGGGRGRAVPRLPPRPHQNRRRHHEADGAARGLADREGVGGAMPGQPTEMIVLDSHVLVWARADERRLSAAARRAILGARAEGGLAVAAISLYEVARLFALGHLRAVATIGQAVRDLVEGVTVLPLTPGIAALATSFPRE